MLQTVALSFVASLLATNATPHFVKGITKEQFPSSLGNSPVANLIAGWLMYVLMGIFLFFAHPQNHPVPAATAAAAAALVMGLFHSTVGAFGKGGSRPPLPASPNSSAKGIR